MLRFQHCAICSCFFCSLTLPRAVSNLDIREKIRQQAHEDFEVVSWKRSCESHTDARKETWPHSAEETCWKHRMELEFSLQLKSQTFPSLSPPHHPQDWANPERLEPTSTRFVRNPALLRSWRRLYPAMSAWELPDKNTNKTFRSQFSRIKEPNWKVDLTFFIHAQIDSKLEALSRTEVQASLLLSS